jgi:epsin
VSRFHRHFSSLLELSDYYRPNPTPNTTNPFPFTDPTPYAVGLQPQFTSIQPQFTQMQPQFTSFNPYQQQAEQEAAQVRHLRRI